MKRTLVGIVLAGLYATASAQGYVGAVVSLSNYDLDCHGFTPCDKKGKGFKVYAGSQFKEGLLDTPRVKIDTIEVSFMRFGDSKQGTGTRVDERTDPDTGDPIITNRAMTARTSANALTVAGVGRLLITKEFTASAKAGVAYVQTTVDQYVGGASWGSDTKGKFKPYFGLGLEYALTSNLKVVGSFDYTRYEGEFDGMIDGQADNSADNVVSSGSLKGSLYQLGLGVQMGF